MKRLIRKKSYKDQNLDIREQVLMTTPCYPSFPDQHSGQFQESDDKSYSRMMNNHTIQLQKERGEEDKQNTYFAD